MFSSLTTFTYDDLGLLLSVATMLGAGLAVYKIRGVRKAAWNRKVQTKATEHGAELLPWPQEQGWQMVWTHWGVTIRFCLRRFNSDDAARLPQFFEIAAPGGLPKFSARVGLSNSSRTPGFNAAFEQRFTVPTSEHDIVRSILSEPMQAELARLAGVVASGEIRSDGRVLVWRPGVDLLDELPAALQLARALAERLAGRRELLPDQR
ncbi:hypothetical protein DB30_04573 [Enhygromyxa salina]|uniref:Uncharacterized protein n=1 Tax=Enhygromyxa salina TaxID=215803 RepID=A0A0C2A6T1_9BACT|nr:hypothetical protein [Enhygromyxa salina]KIG19108.1 hypothetical protein DB30_04573 [Enhygromyxa salina]